MLDRIRAWTSANPGTGWVVASGWSPDQFKNGLPTRHLLDSVIKDRPALIYAADEGDRLRGSTHGIAACGHHAETPIRPMVRSSATGGGVNPGVLRGAVA